MNEDFLLVHKDILPDVFTSVIKARDLINKEGFSITEACIKVGISRSVYYKYKDHVFLPNNESTQKVIITFRVEDKPGVLNSILTYIASTKANVLTINQDMPINGLAFITLMIDISPSDISVQTMVNELHKLKYIKKVEVIAYE